MGVKIPYLTQTGNYAGNILKICLEVDQSGATNIQYSITKKAMLSGPASKKTMSGTGAHEWRPTPRSTPLVSRLSVEEKVAHDKFISTFE